MLQHSSQDMQRLGTFVKLDLFSSKSTVAKQSRKVLTSWSALLLSNEPLASAQE